MTASCPTCGRAAPRTGAESTGGAGGETAGRRPSYPFCSAACKLVDLGRWLDGAYRIAGPPVDARDMSGTGSSNENEESEE